MDKFVRTSILLLICSGTVVLGTLPGPPSPGPSGPPTIDPDEIVRFINEKRAIPHACDMSKIEWNSTLAAKAGYLLDCHLPRPSVTRDFAQSGYIYSILARRVTADTVAETAIYSWAGNHVVKRQLFNAEACEVGCAGKACPRRYHFVCLFNDRIKRLEHPFTAGNHCTCCPDSKPDCYNESLCYDDGDGMSGGGDPHFSVRVSSGQLFCFNLRGEAGFSFNLISTYDLEMNTLFIELPNRRHPGSNNRMGAIGISVAGNELVFNGTSEIVCIANNLTLGPDRVYAITVDTNHQIRLSLTKKRPNNKITVHIEQFSITLTIIFIHQHLDMFWSSHKIDTHNIHGLLGQFLHPEVKIDEEQGLLFLPWRSAVSIKRRTVFTFARSEDPEEYKDATCWTPVERSSQGAGFIEGVYTDYEVGSILSNGFQFGVVDHQGNF